VKLRELARHLRAHGCRSLASIIDRVRADHEPVYLARRGRRVVAVIDADDLDEMIELAQDMNDIRAAEAAERRCERPERHRSRGMKSSPVSA
jgi:prevent-host-death family protein